MRCTLGVDIGTSSSKGVLVDGRGEILASAVRTHEVSRPRAGHVEMDGSDWWEEFVSLTRELLNAVPGAEVVAVGVSGMGPCVLLTDERGAPVRPAILYGIDTRASRQIESLEAELGRDEIAARCGSLLSSQAAGPKMLWVAEEEPAVWDRARRLFMPASWLAWNLTGEYALDHQSASQSTPFYDIEAMAWNEEWWNRYLARIERPPLLWAGDVLGGVTAAAAAATGLPSGVPVVVGTIDAWSEAVSVGAHGEGDLMLMYGTTMFLISTNARTLRSPSMWTTAGAFEGTRNLAGGLGTSGALTAWISDLTRADYPELLAEAECSGVGARGLLMLPYFAGERTPILDPDARGVIAGLTLEHTRGDIYRAALEATALGVRHNMEAMREAGAVIDRVVAVGGGTKGDLWVQIVSDVTGLVQEVPEKTIGASYGAAHLAARAVDEGTEIERWNPVVRRIEPRAEHAEAYRALYDDYRALYAATEDIVHRLARRGR